LTHIQKQSFLPVIAAGGIMGADDAMARLDAGATLIQIYTGFIYRGPGLINQTLQKLIRRYVEDY